MLLMREEVRERGREGERDREGERNFRYKYWRKTSNKLSG